MVSSQINGERLTPLTYTDVGLTHNCHEVEIVRRLDSEIRKHIEAPCDLMDCLQHRYKRRSISLRSIKHGENVTDRILVAQAQLRLIYDNSDDEETHQTLEMASIEAITVDKHYFSKTEIYH
jgi:hypothetical protein